MSTQLTKQLLRKGNAVIATTRSLSRAEELQQLASQSEGRLTITELDVASSTSIEAWAASLKPAVSHLDLVINNAGIVRRAGLADVTAADMLDCFVTNTIGPLLVTQQLHKQGLLRAESMVAQITSKVGSIDDNGRGGSYAYRASKAALNIVNKSLSIDLKADNVTCVLLHPGYVRTDMTGGQGLIDVDESVSGLISVLESDRPLNGKWYAFDGKEIPW
ncbi:hypothetical protein N2152v2_008012 [Parachlorella kessleri]